MDKPNLLNYDKKLHRKYQLKKSKKLLKKYLHELKKNSTVNYKKGFKKCTV
jgi:hypothetical protein